MTMQTAYNGTDGKFRAGEYEYDININIAVSIEKSINDKQPFMNDEENKENYLICHHKRRF
jgi:hypothetical protein